MDRGRSVMINMLALLGAVACVIILFVHFWEADQNALVVYCAHDSVYSKGILKKFEKKTGIKVAAKFDTEATKSLGLVELLAKEKSKPRCDVFWNNELLGTLYLKNEGVLEPYKGAGYQRIPEGLRDPDGEWAGFGARMRVFIINTEKCAVNEDEISKRMNADDLSRVAIAKPLYGTTLTHYCCLWQELGEKGLKDLHNSRLKRKICVLNGNGAVKNAVANGVCDLGWTDTDDFFVAKDDGKPVDMLPVKIADTKVICIPNTVAMIKGTKKAEKAKKLIDFLLSEECELALANCKSRQIPLGPVDESKLSDDVKTLRKWSKDAYPLNGLSKVREPCLAWLKSLYLKK